MKYVIGLYLAKVMHKFKCKDLAQHVWWKYYIKTIFMKLNTIATFFGTLHAVFWGESVWRAACVMDHWNKKCFLDKYQTNQTNVISNVKIPSEAFHIHINAYMHMHSF